MKPLNRAQIAWRAAQDIADGSVVNLGIGMPVEVSNYLPADRDVFFQSENGVIGVGPGANESHADKNLVDAGSRKITLREGATIVDSAASFAMIRGGHIDITVLGAFEVAANGDLANWDSRVPHKGALVGGAMDLAVGAKATWVMMAFNTKDGGARLKLQCSLPLTARACVTRMYTDIAVVDVGADGFIVREMIANLTAQELQAKADAPLIISDNVATLSAPKLN